MLATFILLLVTRPHRAKFLLDGFDSSFLFSVFFFFLVFVAFIRCLGSFCFIEIKGHKGGIKIISVISRSFPDLDFNEFLLDFYGTSCLCGTPDRRRGPKASLKCGRSVGSVGGGTCISAKVLKEI